MAIFSKFTDEDVRGIIFWGARLEVKLVNHLSEQIENFVEKYNDKYNALHEIWMDDDLSENARNNAYSDMIPIENMFIDIEQDYKAATSKDYPLMLLISDKGRSNFESTYKQWSYVKESFDFVDIPKLRKNAEIRLSKALSLAKSFQRDDFNLPWK